MRPVDVITCTRCTLRTAGRTDKVEKQEKERERERERERGMLGSKENHGYPVIVRYLSSEFRYTGYI